MLKSRKLFRVIVISVVVSGVVPIVSAKDLTESRAQNNTNQQIYISQMEKYPTLSKEFYDVIQKNIQPPIVPAEDKELYRWQMDKYVMLNDEFASVYTQNLADRPVPQTAHDLYLWQLESYKRLDKEFYNVHRSTP